MEKYTRAKSLRVRLYPVRCVCFPFFFPCFFFFNSGTFYAIPSLSLARVACPFYLPTGSALFDPRASILDFQHWKRSISFREASNPKRLDDSHPCVCVCVLTLIHPLKNSQG